MSTPTSRLHRGGPARSPLVGRTACAVLLVAASAAGATPCLFRGDQESVRVVDRSGAMYRPFPQSLTHADCTKLRIVAGTGAALVYPLHGSALPASGIRVEQGALVRAAGSQADERPAGGTRLFAVLKAVLESEERVVSGSSRSTEADYLRSSLPVGRLAEPAEDLRIPLRPETDPNLQVVELQVGDRVVHRATSPASAVVLPASHLRAGQRLRWRVVYGGEALTGEVEVVPPAHMREIRDADGPAPATTDPTARQLRAAERLLDAGFTWDARQVLAGALSR